MNGEGTAKIRSGDTMNQELLERYAAWLKAECDNVDKTIKNKVHFTKKFLEWLDGKGISIEEVDQDIVNEYILYCKEKYSRNSLVPITANLRKLLNDFMGKGLKIKMARVHSADRDKTALTKEEIEAIFREASDDPLAEAILKTLYYSGIRRNELINLNIEDIDFNRLQITIRHGKGDGRRVVNISRDCAMALKRWLLVRPKPKKGREKAVFISPRRTRISTAYLHKIVKEYAARAGIGKPVYPHKFRITMITHMAEAGLSPREIQAQSGHRDIKVLMEYIQHVPDRIRKAYDEVFSVDTELTVPNKFRVSGEEQHYKKLAIQRYLDGEIDHETLYMILQGLEEKKKPKTNVIDLAYS